MRCCALCRRTILPRQGVIISADEAGSGPSLARYAHPSCAAADEARRMSPPPAGFHR